MAVRPRRSRSTEPPSRASAGLGPSGHIPFTPRSKKVLELSLREALQLGHNYIGTEHLLLGVVRADGGVAAAILGDRGITPDEVRVAVLDEIQKLEAEQDDG